jgi:hypothetical protein
MRDLTNLVPTRNPTGSRPYVLIRFDFNWLSGDAAIFTKIIQSGQTTGSLQGTVFYSYGFGYQATAVVWSSVTSVPVAHLQLYLFPVLGVLPTFLVYPLFLRFLKSRTVALLASFLFGMQSDVLFTTYRSTHEKFTWALIATALKLFLVATTKVNEKRPFTSTAGIIVATYVLLPCQ